MRDERALRVAEAARTVGADWALLSSPDAVATRPSTRDHRDRSSPFAGGPTSPSSRPTAPMSSRWS